MSSRSFHILPQSHSHVFLQHICQCPLDTRQHLCKQSHYQHFDLTPNRPRKYIRSFRRCLYIASVHDSCSTQLCIHLYFRIQFHFRSSLELRSQFLLSFWIVWAKRPKSCVTSAVEVGRKIGTRSFFVTVVERKTTFINVVTGEPDSGVAGMARALVTSVSIFTVTVSMAIMRLLQRVWNFQQKSKRSHSLLQTLALCTFVRIVTVDTIALVPDIARTLIRSRVVHTQSISVTVSSSEMTFVNVVTATNTLTVKGVVVEILEAVSTFHGHFRTQRSRLPL